MRRILLLAVIVLAALSTAAIAIQINDGEPHKLIPSLLPSEETSPKETLDEFRSRQIPKGDLGITLDQATKGLEKIIPRVSRMVLSLFSSDESGEPGFGGSSADGKIVLTMWRTEAAIKTINLVVPFSVDPYLFSLGSWADMERPKEILISCLNGAFPADSRENSEWIEGYVRTILSHPLRNSFKNNEVETQDGRVLFENQKPLIRKISSKVEMTLSSGLFGNGFTLEITPPRKKTGGAKTSIDKTKSDKERATDIRGILQAYMLDVQAVMSGGNRDEKLAIADLSLKTSCEALLLNSDKLDLDDYTNLTTKMGYLLAKARFLSNPKPSWIFKKDDFVAARKEYDALLTYLQSVTANNP
jgi:hypothetical protein